jgi:hypothetical protein
LTGFQVSGGEAGEDLLGIVHSLIGRLPLQVGYRGSGFSAQIRERRIRPIFCGSWRM